MPGRSVSELDAALSGPHWIHIGFTSGPHRVHIGSTSALHGLYIAFTSPLHRLHIGSTSALHWLHNGSTSALHRTEQDRTVQRGCLAAVYLNWMQPRLDDIRVHASDHEDELPVVMHPLPHAPTISEESPGHRCWQQSGGFGTHAATAQRKIQASERARPDPTRPGTAPHGTA